MVSLRDRGNRSRCGGRSFDSVDPRRVHRSERRIGITKELWYLAKLPSGDHLIGYMESADFSRALPSFVGSRDPFDMWFKEQMLGVTGLDLNNPPADMQPPELISHYEVDALSV
jgi:hypothetical protein